MPLASNQKCKIILAIEVRMEYKGLDWFRVKYAR